MVFDLSLHFLYLLTTLVCSLTIMWLGDISRAEFQKVYDILDVKLDEVGESYYNPMIPAVIEELQQVVA